MAAMIINLSFIVLPYDIPLYTLWNIMSFPIKILIEAFIHYYLTVQKEYWLYIMQNTLRAIK